MDEIKLYAPEAYWRLTAAQKTEICNGCGTKGLCGLVVPDTIYGLCITPACDIHDYMYHVGETLADKQEADRVFINNMLRLINAGRFGWVKWLRRWRAMTFYTAVCDLGGPAFWSGKQPANEGTVNA